ncbi:MAG TPA: response regulator transcription factor [Acidimicrobiia bacterium]|nr:response regulator transcription factor [Acidimicrobiia bacterium]
MIYHRDALFVDAMTSVLRDEAVTLHAATCIDSLVELAVSSHVCVIDMRMEHAHAGLRTLADESDCWLICLVEDGHARQSRTLQDAGANAVVSVDEGLDRLVSLIRRRGDAPSEHPVPRRTHSGHDGRHPRDPSRLTSRESEVLEGLMRGESTKQLAARLGVSRATARTHVQSVLTKLGAHSRLEAVALASRAQGAHDVITPQASGLASSA